MLQQITGSNEIEFHVNSKYHIMSFDWFVSNADDDIIAYPANTTVSFSRRLIGSERKDDDGNITSESWEQFDINPIDMNIQSIAATYITTDKLRVSCTGIGATDVLNINIHQHAN